MKTSHLASTLLPLIAATSLAQDPPAPPGGFAVSVISNNAVTWFDGYQTLMDVYEPVAATPPTGWPGVLIVHGGGGNKTVPNVVNKATALAQAGYVCYAYDVRGEGSTVALNPGWIPVGQASELELHDSAESHGVAQALLPGKLDPARIALTGFSQGGEHAAMAAAYSGRSIPCSLVGCPITAYPTVLAVAPEGHGLSALEKSMPGGLLANDEFVNDLTSANPVMALLAVEDYAGAYALLAAQFPCLSLVELQTSTVPMHVSLNFLDYKHQSNPAIDAYSTLLAGVPRRLLLTTGGHSTVQNGIEGAFQTDAQRRWFDHFLKGLPNGVLLETPVETVVVPDVPVHLNPASSWEHRMADVWPPAIAPTSFHLRGGGNLTVAPPPAVEAGPVLVHNVAAGYDLGNYVAQGAGGAIGMVLASIPLAAAPFVSAPLPATMEIFGRSHVVLFVNDNTGVFQLSAQLSHVGPGGGVFPIAFGTGGIRTGAAGQNLLEFDLGDIAHVVPAGHALQLEITNLALHTTPTYAKIRFAPYFTSTMTSVRIAPGAPSHIELPLREYVPNMLPRLAVESIAAGIGHAMRIRGDAVRAGFPYLVMIGASGEAPGITSAAGAVLPLNVDPFTLLGLNLVNTATLPATLGALNGLGEASPGFATPAGAFPGLAGLRFTFAGVVLDPGVGTVETVGPSTLVVDP